MEEVNFGEKAKEETKELSLKEKIDVLFKEREPEIKRKSMRMPRKGKLNKRAIKNGYTTILRIDENGNVDFERQKIIDSTYKTSDGTYHALSGELNSKATERGIFSYRGKPLIIQTTNKINPYNPLDGKNETVGQKHIMARMLNDTIKVKSKMNGGIILWIVIGLVVVGVAAKLFGFI